MPKLTWEWKVTPQIIVSIANLAALVGGLLWGIAIWSGDIGVQKQTIVELRAVVKALTDSQALMAQQVTKVQTQVDMMLPALQRIEANQHKLAPR